MIPKQRLLQENNELRTRVSLLEDRVRVLENTIKASLNSVRKFLVINEQEKVKKSIQVKLIQEKVGK